MTANTYSFIPAQFVLLSDAFVISLLCLFLTIDIKQ